MSEDACSWIPTTPAKPNSSKWLPEGNSVGARTERLTSENIGSFQELLAVATTGKLSAPGNDFKATAAFAPPCLQPQIQDGRSSCSVPFFDLNKIPESNTEDSSSKTVVSEFEPLTPEKSVVKRPDSATQHSVITTTDDVEGLHKGGEEGPHSSTNHQLHASVSSALENHRPDKGSLEEADSSKQRKPIRKKHRPKVITESKPRANSKQRVEISGPTQDATPVKRKPGRPKANGNTPSPGNETYAGENNTPSTADAQVVRRTYSRRKKMNKTEETIEKGTAEEIIANAPLRETRSSCRRSLNSSLEGHVTSESPLNGQSREKSDTGKAKSDPEIATEVTGTADQELHAYVARQTLHFPSPSPCYYNTGLPQSSQQLADKGTNNTQAAVNPEREERGLKRQHFDAPVEPGFSNMAAMGVVYNSLQASTATFTHCTAENGSTRGWCFPEIIKRKRTEKKHTALAFSSHYKTTSWDNFMASTTEPSTSTAGQGPSSAQHSSMNLLADCMTKFLAAASIETVKRKRSKGATRMRDIASLMFCSQIPTHQASSSRVERKVDDLREPQTCMEALVAYNCLMNSIPKTKKRSKRSIIPYGFVQNWDFATQSMGPPLAITWTSTDSIDSITEQLSELNLNAEISEESARNLSMAYRMHYQEQRSLVPYRNDGTIVPFGSSFAQVKRKKPRAKVDLDDETTRVWNLLLENINSEGIDGEDDEKAKWWEEERRIFKGRSDSFIARMHLVQGDRRFSPWKGSVVDSVVGVFLTQNVSDHLSSSAFMSLVARYPAKPKNHLSGSTEAHEPDSCMSGPDATFRQDQQILDNLSCGEESSVLLELGNADVRVVNSKKSLGISFDGFTKNVPVMSHDSCCTNKSISPVRDGRDKEDAISSQSSVYSSTAYTAEISKFFSMASEEQTAVAQSNEFAASSEEVYVVYHKETEGKESRQAAKHQSLGGEPTSCHSCDSETLAAVDLSQESDKVVYGTTENKTSITATSGPLFEAASQTTAEDEPQILRPNLRPPTEVQVETEKRFSVDYQSEVKEASSDIPLCSQNSKDTGESSTKADECKKDNSIKNDGFSYDPRAKSNQEKTKREKTEKGKKKVDWDRLREHAKKGGKQREKTPNTMDSVDWDTVRRAEVRDVAETIKERGMNNVLAGRIKDFLDRVVEDHGSIDLEWLRDVPPDDAKEYLLSIRGLGLKSVECVRLLTLHHLAFPVDTNVGRIAVRLGWVPLQPLPESLQLHLLELYPMLESIQKYLWPRLCKLDQKTLYELHYQMITFGKVFCTKSKPNCNACPMRAECRHFASAFASARLSLPAPEEKRIVTTTTTEDGTADQNVQTFTNPLQLLPSNIVGPEESTVRNCQPIVEVPPSPEPDIEEIDIQVPDIEDDFPEDPDEIPTIQLNMEEFTNNVQKIMQRTAEDGDMTKALVALTAEAASIPVPKLKNVSRLRTEHHVYELPDSHPLLEGMDKRELDDPCPYMLAIWTPGETVNSIEPPKRQCSSQEPGNLCNDETCSSCNSIREATLDTVRGTLLIPCRTAMRGSFPLNGTYFQVNEVFADHDSSLTPMSIPRQWLWSLPRRTVYFGTSIPTIFKGLSTEGIQYCFWRGFVCVRGFERKTRAPRPLIARLHFPASHKGKAKVDENH